MTIRRARTADRFQIVEVVNETYDWLREKGVLADGVADWTVATLASWQAAGYECFVWVNAQGRIDGATIGGFETHNGQNWWALKIGATRARTIPDVLKNHEEAFLRPPRLAMEQAQLAGAVGLTAEYPTRWGRLDNLIATFASITVERQGPLTRIWLPFATGWNEYKTRTDPLVD